MPIPVVESCKKRKRRPKFYNFHTFGDPGCPLRPTGPFRDNIRLFLRDCTQPEDYDVEGMPVSCTLLLLQSNNFVVPLYTIEEDAHLSFQPFCDHCRCTGWSGNFVSKRKYHLIIPPDSHWNKRLEHDAFDHQTHLLHGLVHCNGFGHLLCINGIEGDSKYISGREIMDLWDRICNNLRARKITVQDVSKKRSMDLRLLYGVAYGHSWFGKWGYKFCRGSFGVTEHNYNRAIEILSSLDVDEIIQNFHDSVQFKDIKQIIRYYRGFSETQLISLGDLLRFMLTIKSCPYAVKKQSKISCASKSSISFPTQKRHLMKDKSIRYRNFSSLATTLDSRWPIRRLEYAAEVIVDTLRSKKTGTLIQEGMSRQEVRDSARLHIGDTGLLDYVLKSMNNVIVGSHVVRRAVNPKTRVLEYSLHDLGDGSRPIKASEHEPEILKAPALAKGPGAGVDVYNDIVYLYTNLLLNYPQSELVESAIQVILDSKHFVKEWPFKDDDDELFRFICHVSPTLQLSGLEYRPHKDLPPGEIVVLPLSATVLELKQATEYALKDTYCIFGNFEVTEIENMEELEEGELLFGAVESGVEICVRGHGTDINTPLMYEGGPDSWKVRCECGAKDDDGERMVACDICEVWQHTRCNFIADSETVPPLFVCRRCCNSLVPSTNELEVEYDQNAV
ncbi:hypothetical protein K2173_023206 [Erythroxylum novogranatense]|uniref:Zinc finger PHD-type domain-containing protein n=1 Tax=Erythroxylum novogranatense TaxID=1862640 RepID=A0AAV8T872_9ROSI|nr:hypothetical protein K2173_023206 [Erythroxylum novogranatense]